MTVIAIAHLASTSDYSASRYHLEPKAPRVSGTREESPDDYDTRTWREHLHYDPETLEVYIPPMAFKQALTTAAVQLGMKIKRHGVKGILEVGVICAERVMIGIKRDEVASISLMMNADGRRGSGSRVRRTYPLIPSWAGVLQVHVLDDRITKEILHDHIARAGMFVGVGRFRPEKGGFNGRFEVKRLEWSAS